ncbi:hypothetical protein ACI6Q2_03250 [Chitinophagaceae bacterium LWZ2-11]
MFNEKHEGDIHAPYNENDAYNFNSIKIYSLGIILVCVFGFIYALKIQEWVLSFMPAIIALLSWSIIKFVQKIERRHTSETAVNIEVGESKKEERMVDKSYDMSKPVLAIQHVMDLIKQFAAEGTNNQYQHNQLKHPLSDK